MKRTGQQRKAIEVYCRESAKALNDAGYTLKMILEAKPLEVDCTQENIKEVVFRPIVHALYPEKTSTTELDTGEVTRVYEHMNRWMAENFAVSIPFPSYDEISEAQRDVT